MSKNSEKYTLDYSNACGSSRLPDFIIIGAAKSGTTTLHKYLSRHPRLFMPKFKEPQFFNDDSVYARGLAWYQSLFVEAGKDQLCGEASTDYTRWPHTSDVPRRISQDMGCLKFIYIMRHPVERSYSHYAHYMRSGITMTFEEALKKTDILDTSMYMQQIERFLRFFPRTSFLFLLFDDLIYNPQKTFSEILHFLGVDNLDLTEGEKKLSNANIGGVDFFIRQQTTRRLRNIPGVGRVADLLPESLKNRVHTLIKQSFIGKQLRKRFELLPIAVETRTQLLGIFEKPNQMLSEYLERDLSHWYR